MVRSRGCSSKGSGFNGEHVLGGSQSSVTPLLRDLIISFGLHGHVLYKHTCGQKKKINKTPHT